jgi:carboxypeptidase D
MNWPPDLVNISTYLHVSPIPLPFSLQLLMVPPQRGDVIRALHATGKSESWTECRGRIQQEFTDTKAPSSVELIPKVLQKIPMLLFAGDQDFICNYMGIENMIQAMSWNGGTGLGVSPIRFSSL